MTDGLVALRANGIRPIGPDTLSEALPLLLRGFPTLKPAFWTSGFARLANTPRVKPPYGYLLDRGEGPQGILLTLGTERGPEGGPVTNLSGWYVEPDQRWRAPLLLRHALSAPGSFTDLSPSPSVARINGALGFESWSGGELFAFLGQWAAGSVRAGVEVRAIGEASVGLAPWARTMLEDHATFGCICAILSSNGASAPLIFRRIRRRGIPTAQLIYAESRRAVIANRSAVARFLIAQGLLVLTIDADRAAPPVPGTFFRQSKTRYVKGGIDRDRLDYAYSEFVLFNAAEGMR